MDRRDADLAIELYLADGTAVAALLVLLLHPLVRQLAIRLVRLVQHLLQFTIQWVRMKVFRGRICGCLRCVLLLFGQVEQKLLVEEALQGLVPAPLLLPVAGLLVSGTATICQQLSLACLVLSLRLAEHRGIAAVADPGQLAPRR